MLEAFYEASWGPRTKSSRHPRWDIEQMFLRVMTFGLAKSLRQNSNSSTTQFEIYDEEHVRNLHPRIEKQIVQRLGSAITRRRKYLSTENGITKNLRKGSKMSKAFNGQQQGV